jgi:hypothetical protein
MARLLPQWFCQRKVIKIAALAPKLRFRAAVRSAAQV